MVSEGQEVTRRKVATVKPVALDLLTPYLDRDPDECVRVRMVRVAQLARLGKKPPEIRVQLLAEGLLNPTSSRQAGDQAVTRALDKMRACADEDLIHEIANAKIAREEYIRGLKADRERHLALVDSAIKGNDLRTAVAAHKEATACRVALARACGVDTERPIKIEQRGDVIVDWAAMAATLGVEKKALLDAFVAYASNEDEGDE
jgi:hypothetical protein